MAFTDPKISLDKSWKFTPQVLILLILGILVIFGFLFWAWQIGKIPPPPPPPAQPELIEVTETSETYRNPDGTLTTKFYTSPKYYKDDPNDPNEPWKKIDTTIVPSQKEGYDWEMTKAPFKVYFKNDLSKNDALLFEQAGISLTFQLTGTKWRVGKEQSDAVAVSQKEAEVRNNTIIWNGIFDSGFDLKYELSSEYGLKEFWTIDDKEALPTPPPFIDPSDPEAKLDIEFIVEHPDSLKLYANGRVWDGAPVEIDHLGGLTLRDKDGKEIWNVASPTLIDKGKEKENSLFGTYYLSKTTEGDTSLKIALPYHFLAKSNYPVIIDPQVNINPVVGGASSLVLKTKDLFHNHPGVGFIEHNGTYPPRNDIGFDFNYDSGWTGNSPPIHVGQAHSIDDPSQGYSPGFSTSRGYVDFNTSSLGAGATVNWARMDMQRYGAACPDCWNWVSNPWLLRVRWGFNFGSCTTRSCYWDVNPMNYSLAGSYAMPCCTLPPANISINLNGNSVNPAGTTYYMLTNSREESGQACLGGSDNPLLDVDCSEGWSSFNPVLVVNYNPAPSLPTCSTSLSPTAINQGETATFDWSSSNATSCNMSGTDGWSSTAISGSHTTSNTLSAGTYNFGGSCSGPGGSTTCTTRTLTINPLPNNPPAITLGAPSMSTPCPPPPVSVLFPWTADDPENDIISQWSFQVDESPADWNNLAVDKSGGPVSDPYTGNQTIEVSSATPQPEDTLKFGGKSYDWRVRAIAGADSGWQYGQTTDPTPASPPPNPDFKCSLDENAPEADWKSVCDQANLGAIIGETVYFKNFNPKTGPVYDTYQWEFIDPDTGLMETKFGQKVDYIFPKDKAYTAKHTAIDDGTSCSLSKPVNISEKLPRWREIPP